MTIEIKDKGIIEADNTTSLDLRCFCKEEISEILFAYEVAKRAHDGQKRKTGKPYIVHPVEVAHILLHQLGPELGVTIHYEMVIAGLLHDAPEDSDISVGAITKLFGSRVGHLVDLLTKKELNTYLNTEQQNILNELHPHQKSDYLEYIKPHVKPLQLREYYGGIGTNKEAIILKRADKRSNHKNLNEAHLFKPGKREEEIEETRMYFEPLMEVVRNGGGKSKTYIVGADFNNRAE